jgi:hypothetical protein
MSTFLRPAALAAGVGLSAVMGTAAIVAASAVSGTVSVAAAAGAAQPAAGDFTASVDFPSLQTRDVRGNKCEFTVDGTLTFTGTLAGAAEGTTTAIIFAPCSAATTTPPGTYFDVFRFEGTFRGSVNGAPVTGVLSYAGITRVGGAIDATVILDANRTRAALRADATVAVGGSYTGVAKVG